MIEATYSVHEVDLKKGTVESAASWVGDREPDASLIALATQGEGGIVRRIGQVYDEEKMEWTWDAEYDFGTGWKGSAEEAIAESLD